MFAVVAERLNLMDAYKIDSTHKLDPSGSLTPSTLSSCMSGKSLLTLSLPAYPALMALESPLYTVPFC